MPTLRAFLATDQLRTVDGVRAEVFDSETLAKLGCSDDPLMFNFAGEELGPVSITPVSAGGTGTLVRPGKRDHTENFDRDGLLILVPVRPDSQALRAVRLARGRKIGLDIDIQAIAGSYLATRRGAVLSALSGKIGGLRLCADGNPDAVVSIIE